MIQIELTQALALYSVLLAAFIAGIWVYTEFFVRRPQRVLGKQFLWRCVYCGYTYLDEGAERLSQCPRCESFNDSVESLRPVSRKSQEEPEEEDAVRAGSKRKRPNQRRRGPRRRR